MRVDERIRTAASDLQRRLDSVDVPAPPTTTRQPRGWPRALLAAALVLAVFVFLAPPAGDIDDQPNGVVGPPEATPSTVTTIAPATVPTTTVPSTTVTSLAPVLPSEGPLFGVETGVVLLLDDGIDGVLAIDPDRRLAARSVVEGQRAGDEPYSMVRVGDSLVVGWSEIFAVVIATREHTSLGRATIFVPAAEPDRVWLINWPGGAIGSGTPQVWQVTVNGERITEPAILDVDGFPSHGIPGGLAIEHDQGLILWNAENAEASVLEGNGRGRVLDVAANEIIWCSGDCTELQLTDVSTPETQTFPVPDGYETFRIGPGAFQAPSAFSPDGFTLAVIAQSADQDETAIWIHDRRTGQSSVVSGIGGVVDYLAWTPDGSQLFATSWSYGQNRSVVWRFDIAAGELQGAVLPFGGGLAPVVIDAANAAAYFGDDLIDESECRRPSLQPSGRTGICTFSY